jgi:hypothetical protein
MIAQKVAKVTISITLFIYQINKIRSILQDEVARVGGMCFERKL